MKKMSINLTSRVLGVAIATVLAVGSIQAAGIGDLKVKPVEGSKKAIVSVQNIKGEKFSLAVSNSNGWITYYEENSENNDYGKVFDLTNLEDGKYVISFDNKYQIIEKEISIENNTVNVINETKYLKPTFKSEDGLIAFSYYNMNDDKVEVLITDDSGDLLYEEKLPADNEVIQKSFSTKNLPFGNYNIILKTNKNSFDYSFKR